MQAEMAAQQGKRGAGLRLLTPTVISPTLADQIAQLLAAYPQAEWIQWEAAESGAARAGAVQAFGEPVGVHYRFDRAKVILSLDADFLYASAGRLRYALDFVDGRRLVEGRREMNRLYAVESTPTTTGLKADHRVAVRAADVEGVARAIAAGLGVPGVTGGAVPAHVAPAFVPALVKDLLAHKGAAVVVAGEHQPAAVHVLAHAMNAALGAAGQTVIYTAPVEARPADPLAELSRLVADMDAGRVDLLVMAGVNPVYDAPADLLFAERMAKVRLRIFLGLYEDETARLSQWVVPETHFLEAWSDTRAFDGTVSVVQPLIAPLYECHSAHELIAVLSGRVDGKAYDLVREFWQKQQGTGAFGPMTRPDGTADGSSTTVSWPALPSRPRRWRCARTPSGRPRRCPRPMRWRSPSGPAPTCSTGASPTTAGCRNCRAR
jgi:molybdopterin-containing oxidoreductase family iron-sulfur binding subunit